METDFAVLYRLDSRFCQRLHLNKPLFGNYRFNRSMTAVTTAYVVLVRLDLLQNTHFFESRHNLLTRFVAIQSRKFACVFVHRAVVVHNADNGQIVTYAHFEVVRVVSGSNFYNARAEFHIDVFVGYNGNFAVDKGYYYRFAHQMLITFVVRIDGNGGIAEHRLRPRRCQKNPSCSEYSTSASDNAVLQTGHQLIMRLPR